MTRNNKSTKGRLLIVLTALRKVGSVFAPWRLCLKSSRRHRDRASCETCEKSTQGDLAQDAGRTVNCGPGSDAETMVHRTSAATMESRTTVTGPGSTINSEEMVPAVGPVDASVSPVNHNNGSTKPDEPPKNLETSSETQGKESRYLYECGPEIKARRIRDQGQSQRDDFSNSGNIHSLEEAIKCFQEAGDLLRHTSSHDRIFVLGDLAVALRLYHDRTHNADSLAKAIETLREAIQLQPSVAVLKNSLALALSANFDQSGDTNTLIEAIELQKDLVQLSPESQRFEPLTCLATSLAKKFLGTGDEEALIQSIDRHREALKLIPSDDPDHLSPLIELATVLAKRFDGVHDIEAQLKSINGLRQELLPHEGRDSLIEDLSQALGKYFERTRGGCGAEVRIPTRLADDRV